MTVENIIVSKLQASFSPTHLEVINESHMHNVAPGSESHFKVILVSDEFENDMLVKRHKKVYQVLKEELDGGVHALALHTYNPTEWEKENAAPSSPPCMGGGK